MAKKNKNKNKVQKTAMKAGKKIKKQTPLTAAVVALGGFASSLLASEKLRSAAEELVSMLLSRAMRAFGEAKREAGTAVKKLTRGDGGKHERGKEAREDEKEVHAH